MKKKDTKKLTNDEILNRLAKINPRIEKVAMIPKV